MRRRCGPDRSPAALHLIQSVRDEAHRFAIYRPSAAPAEGAREEPARGNRRHPERNAGPRCSSISAVWAALAAAGAEELAKVKGVSRELAERIYAAFHT